MFLSLKQSTASANVRCLESAVGLQSSWRFQWFSRVNRWRVPSNAPPRERHGALGEYLGSAASLWSPPHSRDWAASFEQSLRVAGRGLRFAD